MTTDQINTLKGKYGENNLAIVIFGDGKRVGVTKEMIDEGLIEFDDGNELITFKEPAGMLNEFMSHKNRYLINSFEYAAIIGLVFTQNEEDMIYNGENGEGRTFLTRESFRAEDDEVKLR